jgi:hypothetical protein
MARISELSAGQRALVERLRGQKGTELEIGHLHALRLSVADPTDLRAVDAALARQQEAAK